MEKIVLITGDSSGIGKELVELLKATNTVYGISRRDIEVEGYTHYSCDVLDENKINEVVDSIINKHGRIDLLICAAGLGVSGALEQHTTSDITLQLDVNLKGVINVDKAVIPHMRKTGSGTIVHVSSVAGVAPIPFQALYSASKAALNNYSMALANELKPFKIRVKAVMLGDVKTGFTDSRRKINDTNNIYSGRVERSVSTMEHDERNGMNPIAIAKGINKISNKKSYKCLYTIGFTYKLLVLLIKILPAKLLNRLLYKIYAK